MSVSTCGFLEHYFRTPAGVELLGSVSPGGAGRNRTLNRTAFLQQKIPLPPLPEQQGIVARIEQLAREIDNAMILQSQVRSDLGHLPGVVSGRAFEALQSTYASERFGALGAFVTSGPRNWGKNYEAQGYRFYRAQDIDADGEITNDSKAYVLPPDGRQGRSAMPKPADLLFVITGATVGRMTYFNETHEAGFVSQHVAICRLPPSAIRARYAWWGLRSPFGQQQLLGQRYGQGKPGLNLKNIADLSLPLPPLSVQDECIAELDAVAQELASSRPARSAADAQLSCLMPAILERAFAGAL